MEDCCSPLVLNISALEELRERAGYIAKVRYLSYPNLFCELYVSLMYNMSFTSDTDGKGLRAKRLKSTSGNVSLFSVDNGRDSHA